MIQDGLASSLLLSYSSSLLSSLDTALVWLSSGPGGGSRGGGGGAAAAVHVEATAATARDGAMHGAAVTDGPGGNNMNKQREGKAIARMALVIAAYSTE